MTLGSRTTVLLLLATAFATAFATAWPAVAGDWPTFRHDAGRSGYTAESLPKDLKLQWSHQLPSPPRPAWPRSDRMTFDRVAQPIVADGLVYFGSSVDGTITALDTTTGKTQWTFPTRAPVRFAPAFHEGRLYATSDDGFLYCLKASDGTLLWKKRGGPAEEMILGNGRMISRWPARGGVVLRDDIVYFAAGIWPSDGVSLYALDPATGKELWVNDTAGSLYLGQPHGGAFAKSGAAAQGYLVASEEQIFMPTGRGVPAVFERNSGAFQYLLLQANTHRGGADVVLSDQFFLNNGYAFFQESGALQGSIGKGPVVVEEEKVIGIFGEKLSVQAWADKEQIDRKGQPEQVRALEKSMDQDWEGEAFSMIGAAEQIVAGLENAVRVSNLADGSETWSAEVSGKVYGLAVANQQLFVSTDEGRIYCFGSTPPKEGGAPEKKPVYSVDPHFTKAAEEILRKSKVKKGYCLDMGCGDGSLAIELAKQSDLFIYAIDPDPTKVETARENLIAAGLYGSRVMVLQADLADTKLPDYFANLIVSSISLSGSLPEGAEAESTRLRRPWGGVLMTGVPGQMKLNRRSALKGAGQWTHQYADPANSVNSNDELVRGPLSMLWFSDLEQPMAQRHGRGPAPLFYQGVLYSEGLDSLIAVDAYNGQFLWEYELPGILAAFDGDHLMGTSGTGSNYCVSEEGVFVRRLNQCLRIDRLTGELLSTFTAPEPKGETKPVWGYLACEDGILFGSLSDPSHVTTYRYRPGGDMNEQLTESKTFFALDATSGELIWRYDAEHSLRHNGISIGNRAVVLIDRPQATFDRTREGKPDEDNHPTGALIALEVTTGKELWRNQEDIYGTLSAISEEHHSVLMSYQPTRFRLASEIGGRLSVFDLSDGKLKWETEANYNSRPLLNLNTIYAEGGAWDVQTGDTRPFNFERSYGCGVLAGSRNMMVFRSATLGYFDLSRNEETEDYGGIRPGCWINSIPAGGLVFVPDATDGCKCSYLNQSWIALQPGGLRAPRIQASSISDRKLVTAELSPDSGATREIRFTVDGSSPNAESPLYSKALHLTESTLLRARAFDDTGRPSPVVEQQFTIDPALVPVSESLWRAEDAPRASPASDWSIEDGVIQQVANTMVGGKPTLEDTAAVERPGTLFLFEGKESMGDGEITFDVRSNDNDALGFVLGYRGPEDYHVWTISAERPYRALARKKGAEYQVLGDVKAGYTPRTWHSVRFKIEKGTVVGYFDGKEDFSVSNVGLEGGTIGFYSWGNSGSYFRNLRFVPAKP